jgi:hypothetical protein
MLAAFAIGAVVGSCDAADEAFDCQAVCSRYQDCYDKGYDVGKCRDSCRTRAANDPSIKQAADTCEACIGDKSCLFRDLPVRQQLRHHRPLTFRRPTSRGPRC